MPIRKRSIGFGFTFFAAIAVLGGLALVSCAMGGLVDELQRMLRFVPFLRVT